MYFMKKMTQVKRTLKNQTKDCPVPWTWISFLFIYFNFYLKDDASSKKENKVDAV